MRVGKVPSWEGEKLGTAVGDVVLLRSSSAQRGRVSGLRVEILSSGELLTDSRSVMRRATRAARSTSGLSRELGSASAVVVGAVESRGDAVWVFRAGNKLWLGVDDVDEFGEL